MKRDFFQIRFFKINRIVVFILIFHYFFQINLKHSSNKESFNALKKENIQTKQIKEVSNTTKVLKFSSTDIKSIDIYKHFISGAVKKIITGKIDIKTIINDINSIKIMGNATRMDLTYGGWVLTFVFNKTDGTQFIIFYNGSTFKTPDGSPNQFWYKIDGQSLFSKWDNLNYSAQKVSQNELPIIFKN